jgi:hypothetical protein
MKHAAISGGLVLPGVGGIGQGALPPLPRHIDMPRERTAIATADDRGAAMIATCRRRDRRQGDFLPSLSVDMSSVALIAFGPGNRRGFRAPARSRGLGHPGAAPGRSGRCLHDLDTVA